MIYGSGDETTREFTGVNDLVVLKSGS